MPDLGKAVYTLVLNTGAYTGPFKEAEATAVKSTEVIGTSVQTATGKLRMLGTEAGVMGTQVAAGMTEAATSAEGAAAKTVAATTAMADGTKRAAVAAERNFGAAGAAMFKFGSVGGRSLHLLGLAVLYETVRSGISTLNANTQSMAQMRNVIESTGGVAGVTAEHAADLAHHWEMVAGSERAATQGMMAVLMGFTNIRNSGKGVNAIFDRTVQAIENVSARTGKSLQQVSIAVGKAIQDPGKYMTALARTGVTFTKQQIAMAKSLWESNQPMKAQQYILDALEKRYGAAQGAAYAFGQTAQGQFDIAKNKLGEASAQIMTALLPAFVTATHWIVKLTTVLGHHATAVKYVALAYVGLKAAAIAFRLVMEIVNSRLVVGTARMLGFGAAATTAEGEVAAAGVGMNLALLPILGTLALIVAGVAAVALAFTNLMNMLPAKWNPLGGLRAHLANGVLGATHAPTSPGGNSPSSTSAFVQQIRARYAYLRKSGMSDADAVTAIMRQNPGVTKHDVEIYARKAAGAAPAGEPGTAKPLGKGDVGTVPKKPKSYGLLPIQMQIDEAEAMRHGAKAQIAVLNREYGYLSNLLKTTKSLPKRLEIEQQLSSIYGSLQSLKKTGTSKSGGYHGLIPVNMAISYQKALQTKGLGDDIKQLKLQETYLQTMLKNHKLSAAKQLAVMKELTSVKKKLAEDLKKEKQAQDSAKHLMLQQLQAFVDTRGSFFSQFASSVFHGGPGGLSMGAAELAVRGGSGTGGNGMTYNQHNTFHEIPEDRYKLSRQMQAAAAGAN